MKFIKYNNNPKKNRTNDYVIRAIALATNSGWELIYRELAELGIKHRLALNDYSNWTKYLRRLGYKRYRMPKRTDNRGKLTGYTVEEFVTEIAKENEIYIVTMQGRTYSLYKK